MKNKTKFLLMILMISSICGCGVRGDPVPPLQPTELGRGQPTYREATKDLATPYVPPVQNNSEKENEKKKTY